MRIFIATKFMGANRLLAMYYLTALHLENCSKGDKIEPLQSGGGGGGGGGALRCIGTSVSPKGCSPFFLA